MNSIELIHDFSEWLITKKMLAESTSNSYVRGIKNSENYYHNKIDLFSVNDDTVNIIVGILNNPIFIEDNKYKHNTMSSALKHYAEYLTLCHRNELFVKWKKNTQIPIHSKENEGGGNVEPEHENLLPKNENQPKSIVTILLEQISRQEKEQQRLLLAAYDIEDVALSESAEETASSNIRKIKQWKKDLTKIFTEMSEDGFNFDLLSGIFENVPISTANIIEPVADPKTIPPSSVNMPIMEKPLVSSPPEDAPIMENPLVVPPPVSVPTVEIPSVAPPPVGVPVVETTSVTRPPVDMTVIETTQLTATSITSPLDKKINVPLNPKETKKEEFPAEKDSTLSPRKKTIKYLLFGKTYFEYYWNMVLVQFCEIMIKLKPEVVATFPDNEELKSRNRINFSYQKEQIVFNRKRLSNKMWIETNRSAQNIQELCYKILRICEFSESELVFIDEGIATNQQITTTDVSVAEIQKLAPTSITPPNDEKINRPFNPTLAKNENFRAEQCSTPNPRKNTINYQLLGETNFANYWKELFVDFCEIMVKYKPEIVATFPENEQLNSKNRINFSYNKYDVKYHRKELSNNMWVETNHSAQNTQELCYQILSICEFSERDLIFIDEGGATEIVQTSVSVPEKQKVETPIDELCTKNAVVDGSPIETQIGVNQSEETSSIIPAINQGCSIGKMCLLGKDYAFDTASEFFIKVCEMMVLHRPYAVGTFSENKSLNSENNINFSYLESDMNNHGKRLNNGLWVNKNQEESKIVDLCYRAVNACGFEKNDLKFTLKGG